MAFPQGDSIAVFNDMPELPACEIDPVPSSPIDPITDWVNRKD